MLGEVAPIVTPETSQRAGTDEFHQVQALPPDCGLTSSGSMSILS